MRQQLTWTHYRLILPLKNENDFYVNYVEDNIKDINHNKTIGLLIVKENDKYVIKYTTSNDILVTTYALN